MICWIVARIGRYANPLGHRVTPVVSAVCSSEEEALRLADDFNQEEARTHPHGTERLYVAASLLSEGWLVLRRAGSEEEHVGRHNCILSTAPLAGWHRVAGPFEDYPAAVRARRTYLHQCQIMPPDPDIVPEYY